MRYLVSAAIVAAIPIYYVLSCWIFPMRDCRWCDGQGHHRPTDGNGRRRRISRPCRWCKGSGKRLRIGRRLWNRARQSHRTG